MKMDYRTDKSHRKIVAIVAGLALGLLSAGAFIAQAKDKDSKDGHHRQVMWVNHMSLLPGDVSVSTSFNSTTSEVGGGLTGLGVESSTLGEVDSLGGNKVVHMALDLPKQTKIKRGTRVLRINRWAEFYQPDPSRTSAKPTELGFGGPR